MQIATSLKQNRHNRVPILSAAMGSILEWYDFAIYLYLAPILSALFFPAKNAFISLIMVYALFLLSYLVRPLGGMLFGYMGDRFGRKRCLTASLVWMAVPTCLMGIIPTYQEVGVIAPLLLLVLRLLQGLAAGGEMIASTTYAFESVSEDKKAFASGAAWIGSGIGMLLGSAIVGIVSAIMPTTWWHSVGWRLPFLLGLITGSVGYFYRKNLVESVDFSLLRRQTFYRSPLLIMFKQYLPQLVYIFILCAVSSVCYYLVFVFLPSLMHQQFQLPMHALLLFNAFGMLIMSLSTLVFAWVSDYVEKRSLMYLALAGLIVFSPLLFALIMQGTLWAYVVGQLCFSLLLGSYAGSAMYFFLSKTPIKIRLSLVSLAYNAGYAVFGGTTPIVATYLIHRTHILWLPAVYLSLLSLCALGVFIWGEHSKKLEAVQRIET